MFERAKKAVRGRLVNAAREAVQEARPEELRFEIATLIKQLQEERTAAESRARDLLAAVDALGERLDVEVQRVREAVAGFEHRQRRDIGFASDVRALTESADFVLAAMATAPRFSDQYETLRHGLGLLADDVPGMALEFGVGEGTTLRIIAEHCTGRHVAGFDVFSGLPETWRSDFPAGTFAQESLPQVPGAELVVGLFEDTLGTFLAEHTDPVAFLHLDADLYSSTQTVLAGLGRRLRPGSVIVFDEYFNFPGWKDHEHKAWGEFVEESGLTYRWESYSIDHEQVVATVLSTPWS